MFPYWKTCKARKHLQEFGEFLGIVVFLGGSGIACVYLFAELAK